MLYFSCGSPSSLPFLCLDFVHFILQQVKQLETRNDQLTEFAKLAKDSQTVEQQAQVENLQLLMSAADEKHTSELQQEHARFQQEQKKMKQTYAEKVCENLRIQCFQ